MLLETFWIFCHLGMECGQRNANIPVRVGTAMRNAKSKLKKNLANKVKQHAGVEARKKRFQKGKQLLLLATSNTCKIDISKMKMKRTEHGAVARLKDSGQFCKHTNFI